MKHLAPGYLSCSIFYALSPAQLNLYTSYVSNHLNLHTSHVSNHLQFLKHAIWYQVSQTAVHGSLCLERSTFSTCQTPTHL